jgi:hypothetical protein
MRIKTRRLKKADWEADFFFIGILELAVPTRRDSVTYYAKLVGRLRGKSDSFTEGNEGNEDPVESVSISLQLESRNRVDFTDRFLPAPDTDALRFDSQLGAASCYAVSRADNLLISVIRAIRC